MSFLPKIQQKITDILPEMIILETKRLFLCALSQKDFADIFSVLSDKETMYAYEHGFSKEEVQALLTKQLQSYRQNSFGFWDVRIKETEKCIGLCGITIQPYREKTVPELGYIFQKEYWHKGYAAESAIACRDYAFKNLQFKELYAFIRDTNIPSQKLAERIGMQQTDSIIKYYYNFIMPHIVYKISA